ncbi:MAG: type II toxin-antitoxin system PemK/MazF family toxin [Pleurocapsa sp.]
MKRGEIYTARLEPVEGSEQGGTRPVIIVSRDAINQHSPVVLAVPCTTYRSGKRVFPTQVLIKKSESGLTRDSIAMADQVRVLAKPRLIKLLGNLSAIKLKELNKALVIALDI